MGMDQFNIDRLLRSKLSKPADGPDDAARDLMAQMLRDAAREKKKKRGLWWFFLLIGLTGLSWGVWFFTSGTSVGIDSKDQSISQKREETNVVDVPQNTTSSDAHSAYPAGQAASSSDTSDTGDNRDNGDNEISNSGKALSSPMNPEINSRGGKKTDGSSAQKTFKSQTSIPESGNKKTGPDDSILKSEQPGSSVTSNQKSGNPDTTDLPREEKTKERSEDNDNASTSSFSETDSSQTILSSDTEGPQKDSLIITPPLDSVQPGAQINLPMVMKTDFQKYWEVSAGAAFSKFNVLEGTPFAKSDREIQNSIFGWSPDFALKRSFNRFKVGLGISTFKFTEEINEDSIRVADGQVIVIDEEFSTIEYYDTALDELLRSYKSITAFSSLNLRAQAGYNLLINKRIQITPSLGLEYQRSQYEELSYKRIGFYILVQDTDPPVDYYTIWHNKDRRSYSDWGVNGLISAEISTQLARSVFLTFEPVVHYPLKSNADAPRMIRFDARLSVAFRLYR